MFGTITGLVNVLLAGIPNLWVTTPQRAIIFLCFFWAVVLGAIAAERSALWEWLLLRRHGLEQPFAHNDLTRIWAKHLASLETTIEEERPQFIVWIGGSTVRELLPADDHLSALINDQCPGLERPIQIVNFAFSALTNPSAFQRAWSFASEDTAAVVFGFNTRRFIIGHEQAAALAKRPRVQFGSNTRLQSIVQQVDAPRVANNFPNLPRLAWISRNFRDIVTFELPINRPSLADYTDPYQGIRNLYKSPVKTANERRVISGRSLPENLPLFDKYGHDSREFWVAGTRQLIDAGYRVEILILPESETLFTYTDTFIPELDEHYVAIEEAGAGITDWRTRQLVEEDDFYDHVHLVRSGRIKIEPALVDYIKGMLPTCQTTVVANG